MVFGCSASWFRTWSTVSFVSYTDNILGRLNTIDGVDEHTTTKPKRLPGRARPARRRRHARRELPHVAHRIADDASAHTVVETEQVEARTKGGGGSSGRGPVDDDDGGRRPDRDGDDARRLLIALGLIAVGATVMSARLLARAGRPPQISSRFFRPHSF